MDYYTSKYEKHCRDNSLLSIINYKRIRVNNIYSYFVIYFIDSISFIIRDF